MEEKRCRQFRQRLSELEAAVESVERQYEDLVLSELARDMLRADADGDPGPDDGRSGDPLRRDSALLALRLLQLRAGLELLRCCPTEPRAGVCACLRQIVDLAARAGCYLRPDRQSIQLAGWFAFACAGDVPLAELLADCMPLRYKMVLRGAEQKDAADTPPVRRTVMVFAQMCRNCQRWGLPQQGAQIMLLCEPAFRELLGDEETEDLFMQLFLDILARDGAALAAAYTDGAMDRVQRDWSPAGKTNFYWVRGVALHDLGRAEQSQQAFLRCGQLRQTMYGPDLFPTAVAMAFYWYQRLLGVRRDFDPDGARFLVDFLEKTLDRKYDDPDYEQQLQLVGMLVFGVLGKLPQLGMRDGTERLLALYIRACETYDRDPALSCYRKRYGYAMAGIRAFWRNNCNQALEYTLRALEQPLSPDGAGLGDSVPMDDETLEYNAAYICCILGDTAQGMARLKALVDKMEHAGQGRNEGVYLRALMVYHSGLAPKDVSQQEAEQLRLWLRQKAGELRRQPPPPPRTEAERLALAPYTAMLEVLYNNGQMLPEDLDDGILVLRTCLDLAGGDTMYQALHAAALYQLMVLLWFRNDPECLRLTEPCWQALHQAPLQSRLRASCGMVITAIQHQFRGRQAAEPYARDQLRELDKQWKSSVHTLNDSFLAMALLNSRMVFSGAYTVLHDRLNETQALELILRYKALAALAGRERNRLLTGLRDGEAASALEKLHQLQNRQAVAYTMPDAGPGLSEAGDLEREIARLSARIERAMPADTFTAITVDALAEKLPEGSAIAEYYCAIPAKRDVFWDNTGAADQDQMMEVYVLRRDQGRVTLHRRRLPGRDIDGLYSDCARFRACCRDAETYADRVARGRKNRLRARLYDALIRPAADLLQGVRTLYIAPEEFLRGIPYGLLGPDEEDTLEQRCTVVEMICGRDLLFDEGGAGLAGACVVGDPDYRAGRSEPEQGTPCPPERGGEVQLYRLPFSRTEAELVARCTGGQCLMGADATKRAVQTLAQRCGVLHIAAHGDFDDTGETDALYSARIYMAGAQAFLDSGVQDDRFGNGILTADEVSRMDLHGAELAVLSACFTGMDAPTAAGSIQGLVSAFAAAGVRYVITSLWEADDFAAAELMRRFYLLLRQGEPVPAALRRAKQSLARATVAELRQCGWAELRRDPDTCAEMRDVLDLCLARADGFQPFADEHCWGGFVCHRCR